MTPLIAGEQAEAKVKEAVESIDYAKEACGNNEPHLREAKAKLCEQIESLPRGAADAQKLRGIQLRPRQRSASTADTGIPQGSHKE